MNLFRSEEHVERWELFNPSSKESIMAVENWAMVLSGPAFRERLEPDIIARTDEYWEDFYARLAKLGRTGSFWT